MILMLSVVVTLLMMHFGIPSWIFIVLIISCLILYCIQIASPPEIQDINNNCCDNCKYWTFNYRGSFCSKYEYAEAQCEKLMKQLEKR